MLEDARILWVFPYSVLEATDFSNGKIYRLISMQLQHQLQKLFFCTVLVSVDWHWFGGITEWIGQLSGV